MFDKKYFDDIWETVHRHEYAENATNSLMQKHGKVRYLDLGCGYGYMVKLLNEKGAFT